MKLELKIEASGVQVYAYEINDEAKNLLEENAKNGSVHQGGNGTLLSGVPGVQPGKVLVLGGGVVGSSAIRVALGMGAEVTVLDRSITRLEQLDEQYAGRLRTIYSTAAAIDECAQESDLIIGAVLIPGASAPKLISRSQLTRFKPGTVMVDVAIDQGGCFEHSRPTTHDEPTFAVHQSVYYCVANMPGAVPNTSTRALTNATLPYVISLAHKGWKQALKDDAALALGLKTHEGKVTHPAVAHAFEELPYMDTAAIL